MRKSGTYEVLGNTKFFIPDSLPPQDPPFHLDAETISLYGDAMLELGKLNEMTSRLPNVEHFIKAYINKEALLSSSIEGINTTLLDVYTQPLSKAKPDKNVQLVMNYTKALYKALSIIQDDNMPIVTRVILSAHKELMMAGEGDRSNPGAYRKQSVKVGNLVPPSPPHIPGLMSDLEKYINTHDQLPTLIKAGLVHVQFETILPFLDGNGRIGRLLIVLMLIESGILLEPIIYPSYYFKKRCLDYYKLLDGVRVNGDFETWIKFYLSVIKDGAIDARRRAQEIEQLSETITKHFAEDDKLSTVYHPCLKALPVFFSYPVISIKMLSSELDVSYNTAKKIILDFVELGFLAEENQKKRGKLFRFEAYFEVLRKEYV